MGPRRLSLAVAFVAATVTASASAASGGAATAGATRDARATWVQQTALPSGEIETDTYTFEVVQGADAYGTTDPAGSDGWDFGGGATATFQACVDDVCGQEQVWSGPASLSPQGVATGENTFVMDPALRNATFTGTLRPDDGGPCTFQVSWASDGSPPVVTPAAFSGGETADTPAAQPAQATASAPCWGVLAQGDGSMSQDLSATLAPQG